MKTLVRLFLVGGFLMGSAAVSMAVPVTDSKTFTVSANVPLSSSVSIAATSINAATGIAVPVVGTALSFNPLSFDTVNSIYTSDHYFSITAGPGAGAGATSVTVSYTEGANPNSSVGGHGLGWKTTGTFVKVVGTTETVLAGHPKKLLKDVTSESITTGDLGVGIFKMYVGIQTNPSAPGEPALSEVFSGADKTGDYTGQLMISATVS